MSTFNAPAVLAAAARRIKPIADALAQWFQGDASVTISNGTQVIPSLAKMTADVQALVSGSAAAQLQAQLDALSSPAGASNVGFDDPVAPAYLKTVSDMLNDLPIDLMRVVPQGQKAGIRARTSTYDVSGCFEAALADYQQWVLSPGQWVIGSGIQSAAQKMKISGAGMEASTLLCVDGTEQAALSFSSAGWASGTKNNSTRNGHIELESLGIKGIQSDGATLSDRVLLSMGGISYAALDRVLMWGSQRELLLLEDFWDSNITGSKFWTGGFSDAHPYAVKAFGTQLNTNAVRFALCHFEGNGGGDLITTGTTNQIVLLGNKHEGTGANTALADVNVMSLTGNSMTMLGCPIAMFQKAKGKHWLAANVQGLQVIGNHFYGTSDADGACAMQIAAQANCIGGNVIGNTLYLAGDQSFSGTAAYPVDLSGNVTFTGNIITCLNPRRSIRAGDSVTVRDNQAVGKGTVNESGDEWVHFSGGFATVGPNRVQNMSAAVGGNVATNTHEPNADVSGSVPSATSGFSPANYASGSVVQASGNITSIGAAPPNKRIRIRCGGGTNKVTGGSGITLASGSSPFSPGSIGEIELINSPGIGWVEVSRVTYA